MYILILISNCSYLSLVLTSKKYSKIPFKDICGIIDGLFGWCLEAMLNIYTHTHRHTFIYINVGVLIQTHLFMYIHISDYVYSQTHKHTSHIPKSKL